MELPVTIGAMSAIPPTVRYRVLDAVARLEHRGEGVVARLDELLEVGGPWLGADPALAEVGHWLLDARHAVEIRRAGCDWLALFPTVESIERLAAVVGDPATPAPVRDRAIWSLANRQLRARHASTLWGTEALQLADDALFKLADAATTAGRIANPELPMALRHVSSDGLAAVFARSPSLWGNALECHATAPLARVLYVSIDDVQPEHRIRVLRLVAATLGDDSVPLLLARSGTHAATLDERLESLFLAVSFGGEAHLPRLEEALRDQPHAEWQRKRARWHVANRGVVPTVRGLRVARSTATIPVADRAAKCGQAADDLAALAKFARHGDPEIYDLWGWMVRGAADPARARELVAAHRSSQPLVEELFLQDLARRGKVKQLLAAQAAPDVGALALAIWGRPLAALELAANAREYTPALACARVLACLRAGRPDLADRLLAEDPPPVEISDDERPAEFPGANERWLAEHAASTQVAISALLRGRAGVLALAQPADPDADPDVASLAPIASIVRRLDRSLRGKFVCVAGELKPAERAAIASIIERTGARVVAGPIPGVDFYVIGDHAATPMAAAKMIGQLAKQGARRLRPEEIEGL